MGNIDSRAAFNGGYLYVKADKEYYYAGDVVYGKIYIRCEVPMQAKHLEVRLKGKEKMSFWRTTGGKNKRRHKVKTSKMLINFRAVCHTFDPALGPLPPGDYTIPFEFTLPLGMPASIMYHNINHHDMPKAVVKYSFKAKIVNHDKSILKYKQLIVVHEPPVAFNPETVASQIVPIKSCCC